LQAAWRQSGRGRVKAALSTIRHGISEQLWGQH
jgi:hypothetical protein